MNGWVYIGIVVFIILGVKFIPQFIIGIIRKSCGKSGHDWQGCKCKKCGEAKHQWEQIQAGEIGTWKSGGSVNANRRTPASSGTIKAHTHKCKICGQVMTNRIRK